MKLIVAAALTLALILSLSADEGMWLFNNFPKDKVKEKYSFEVTDAFLNHLWLSSVWIGAGSGSFVSLNGLIFTNYHIVNDCIAKLFMAQHDYMKAGFYAASQAAE